MSLIDKVGTYLGYAPIHAVNKSSGGHPQLELHCEATHYYDEEIEDYVEVTDQELRAFLVLYGKDLKPLRNCEQVKKVFGWSGSFPELATLNIKETRFLFRVEENVWNDETTLKVNWIDIDTANPTRQISSLDNEKLKALNVKYGIVSVGKKTDKKKPTGKPTVPGASKKKTTKKTEEKTSRPAIPAASEATAPEIPASGPSAPAPKEEKTGSTTREDAWKYIEEQIPKAALSDEDRATAWNEAIEKIHGGPDDDTLTGEEWFKVQQLIISEEIPF